tara:strand:+ start:305 stop:1069 length:765 start_codon:yes stop_codon:yes gene_type:complete
MAALTEGQLGEATGVGEVDNLRARDLFDGDVGGDDRCDDVFDPTRPKVNGALLFFDLFEDMSREQLFGEDLLVDDRGFVFDVDDLPGAWAFDMIERVTCEGLPLSRGGGDRIAVRVVCRVSKTSGELFGLVRRHLVFHTLSPVVPFALSVPCVVGQVALPQAVGADNMKGVIAAFFGQLVRAVEVFDEFEVFHVAKESCGVVDTDTQGSSDTWNGRDDVFGFTLFEVLERVLSEDTSCKLLVAAETYEEALFRP